jgi:hypothetical protein
MLQHNAAKPQPMVGSLQSMKRTSGKGKWGKEDEQYLPFPHFPFFDRSELR